MFEAIMGKVTSALIGKGLEAAFGGKSKQQAKQPVMPNFSDATMGLYSPSPTGEGQEIEMTDHDVTLAMWNKRLFGDNSYTNITIPPLGN